MSSVILNKSRPVFSAYPIGSNTLQHIVWIAIWIGGKCRSCRHMDDFQIAFNSELFACHSLHSRSPSQIVIVADLRTSRVARSSSSPLIRRPSGPSLKNSIRVSNPPHQAAAPIRTSTRPMSNRFETFPGLSPSLQRSFDRVQRASAKQRSALQFPPTENEASRDGRSSRSSSESTPVLRARIALHA